MGVEVKGGVLQYTLREEDTMGRETEHYRPQVEYGERAPRPAPTTIGEEGELGCIYEVQDEDRNAFLAQLVESSEGNNDPSDLRLVDPTDGVCWFTGGEVGKMRITKRYNARLVLTEVK